MANQTENYSVDSEAIASISFDPSGKATVSFHHGAPHTYFISRPELEEWLSAPSKGRYFNDNIRS